MEYNAAVKRLNSLKNGRDRDFALAVDEFSKEVEKFNMTNPTQARMVNDQLMLLERVFLVTDGAWLPGGRKDAKHLIYSPAKANKYGSSAFPGISVDIDVYPGVYGNPTYHTGYETFYLMEHIIDPDFSYYKLCTQITTR